MEYLKPLFTASLQQKIFDWNKKNKSYFTYRSLDWEFWVKQWNYIYLNELYFKKGDISTTFQCMNNYEDLR